MNDRYNIAVSETYKRLWFHRDDVDHMEKLDDWAGLGWFLCGIEPASNGSYYWLRKMPTTHSQG